MSFRLKIILGLVMIQLLLLILLVWSSLNFLRGSNEVELSNRASSMAEILASTLEDKLLSGDRAGLLDHINELLTLPGTVYVRINDPAGKVVAEGGDAAALARPFVEDFLFDDVNDGVYDVATDIMRGSDMIGSVQLGLTVQSISGIMDAARREMATIALIGLGVSIVFSVLLGNYFKRQLTSLRDATRRIASGDIGYQIPVLGGDELAQTAGAFNTMSRKLVSLYAEKQAALTGARQKAQELIESERRVNAVLHHTLDAIITLDENGRIESFNPAAEKIFGYSAGEAVGEGLGILMSQSSVVEHERHLQQFIRGGDRTILGVTRQIEGRRKDGAHFPLEIEISEMEIEGRYLFIATARDITERKQAEAALRQAKDAALESSRSKFEFIANVSQEIRVPVNGMLGAINLLLGTELSPQQRERVAGIHSAGDSLITIINDVLDFSKIEAGKLNLESIEFDLWQTVDLVYQIYRDQAARKGVNLVYMMPYSAPTALRGDPTRLRQLLINLVDNAVKFTAQGEVVLRIEVVEDADADVLLRVSVSDTGPGIAAGTQKRIFEIFTRSEAPLTPRYGSSGLGLVISKRLTEMMGGSIGVESEPGHGSLFWFTCRFAKQPVVKPAAQPLYKAMDKLRVLLVNADAMALAAMQNMVSELGMYAGGVDDGARALHELCTAAERRQPYDLVIFDMMMRGMGGLRFARTVREDKRLAGVRMIMVATTGYRGDSEEVRHAGVQGYLTAPFESDQLYECIAAVMGIDRNDHDTFITRHSLAASRLPQHGHALVVAVDAERQKRLLARLERLGYRASLARDAAQALDATARSHYDLVLVDNEAPELVDAEAIRRLRSREHQGEHIPVVVIVSPAASGAQCQAYRAAGADKCFTGLVDIEAFEWKKIG
jgi:PAS domain S-box-containing protein